MFVHWSKEIHIEKLGKRVVRVECANCGCEYFFNLIRIGTGRASAPYSIGVGRATRDAEKKAEADLERRLKLDQELVPCPKCHWVNDELIHGYRQGRHRGLGTAAVVFAFFGGLVLLPLGWLVYDDLVTAKLLWHYFTAAAVCLGLVAFGLWTLRNLLRNRIQPNRNFPHPPRLPPGIPTSFVIDPETEELVPTTLDRSQSEFSAGWLDFRIGNDHLPAQCCDCLEAADFGCGHATKLTATLHVETPRCSGCAGVAKFHYWRTYLLTMLGGLIVTGVVVATSIAFFAPEWVIFGAIGTVLSLILAACFASRATAPVKVRGLDLTRGTVKLRFRNPQYGELVGKHLSGL